MLFMMHFLFNCPCILFYFIFVSYRDELIQVEEETGINLNVRDMVNLTAFLDPTTSCKVFPSPVILELS